MDQNKYFQVAAYQGRITEKSPHVSLEKVSDVMNIANNKGIDILCMPETYLQGSFTHAVDVLDYSIHLESREFELLCERFRSFKNTTLLLGLNERAGDQFFNTVVAIEQGRCIGKYRKAYFDDDCYSLGRVFPVFEKRGVKYGIIICFDSWYREPAQITALAGATMIFCPSFNRVRKDPHMLERLSKRNHFITRAYDNQCWFICSDIIWDQENSDETCPGYACVLDDNGSIMAVAPPYTETMLTYSIPITKLTNTARKKRLIGTPDLFDLVKEAYEQRIARETFT